MIGERSRLNIGPDDGDFLRHVRSRQLRRIAESKRLSQAGRPLRALFDGLGLTGFAFGALYREDDRLVLAPVLASGALEPVAAAYVAQNLAAGDPIAQRAYRERDAVLWTPFFADPRNRGEDERRRDVVELLLAHGVGCGASLCVAVPGSVYRGLLSVSGPRDASPEQFDRLFAEIGWIARLAALMLADIGLGGAVAPGGRRVSHSETLVLSELAAGLRPAQIAQRLGKSERTVRNQIASAQQRLGARTRDHAVALALRFGLIHV